MLTVIHDNPPEKVLSGHSSVVWCLTTVYVVFGFDSLEKSLLKVLPFQII